MYSQRDIILMPFPYSDLTGFKKRPALIVSNQNLNRSGDRICCLITSKDAKDGLKILQSSFESGILPFTSWIKPHRLFTINEKIIIRKLCTITAQFHMKIINAINCYLT